MEIKNITPLEKRIVISVLRAVKEANMYRSFRKGYRHWNGYDGSDIRMSYREAEWKQGFAYQLGDIIQKLKQDFDYSHSCNHSNKYEVITWYVNAFLRVFLENIGVGSSRLGMVGQKAFDLICYKEFGKEKYEKDMEEENKRNGGIRPPRNEEEAFLLSQYMQIRKSRGHLPQELTPLADLSYDEYLEQIKKYGSLQKLVDYEQEHM